MNDSTDDQKKDPNQAIGNVIEDSALASPLAEVQAPVQGVSASHAAAGS